MDEKKLANTPTTKLILSAAFGHFQGMADFIKETVSTFEKSITKEQRERIELRNRFQNFVEDVESKEAEAWPTLDLQPASTSVIIAIYNGTSDNFKLSYFNWDKVEGPEGDCDIPPWCFKSYTIDRKPPEVGESAVKTYFTYTAGEQSIDILTQVKVDNPVSIFPYSGFDKPEWDLKIRSYGDPLPACKTYIAQRLTEEPYSYRIVIILG